MMSLFTPFDLFIFFKSWFSIFLLSLAISMNYYYSGLILVVFQLIHKNLSTFFYSLKIKSFNKFSNFIFISVITLMIYMNFFSIFSYNFPLTSQISFVFMFSLTIWFSLTMFSTKASYKKVISHFVPEGSPLPLSVFLFIIEIVSNLIRPITLTVRLVANILAGHLLMILLSKLVFIFPLVFPVYALLNLVEIFVALIQGYIFSTMLVLYFSEI